MKNTVIGVAIGTFLCVGAVAPFQARASEAGRRNTTIGLGAATVYLLSQHKWVPAAVAGVATAVAYHNYQADVNARHRRENGYYNNYAYNQPYDQGSYGAYDQSSPGYVRYDNRRADRHRRDRADRRDRDARRDRDDNRNRGDRRDRDDRRDGNDRSGSWADRGSHGNHYFGGDAGDRDDARRGDNDHGDHDR